jgi:hypothetical protein
VVEQVRLLAEKVAHRCREQHRYGLLCWQCFAARSDSSRDHRRRVGPAVQDGQVIRIHPIRHDRAKELGAFANKSHG